MITTVEEESPMSKFIARYRKTKMTRALKQADPIFTIEPAELMETLSTGRL